MVQQGSSRKKVVRDTVHLDFLRKALEWVVDGRIFQDVKTHGNTNWIAGELVTLAVLGVWSEKRQLTAAFGEALVWSKRLIGRAAVGSYRALTSALVTYGGQLVPLLWNRLQALMEEVGKEYWRIGSWLPLAVDGSAPARHGRRPTKRRFAQPTTARAIAPSIERKRARNKRKKNRAKAETVGLPLVGNHRRADLLLLKHLLDLPAMGQEPQVGTRWRHDALVRPWIFQQSQFLRRSGGTGHTPARRSSRRSRQSAAG